MATILLAIGQVALREACRQHCIGAGHTPVLVTRPLAVLTLGRRVAWDVALVDASSLGEDVARMLGGASPSGGVIGIGLRSPVSRSVSLPLVREDLIDAIDEATRRTREGQLVRAGRLCYDRRRRAVSVGEREASLTPTQSRLLELLIERRPAEVSFADILRQVWGYEGDDADSDVVRSHVRNLRQKLSEVGLDGAVSSRRGRGYALTV